MKFVVWIAIGLILWFVILPLALIAFGFALVLAFFLLKIAVAVAFFGLIGYGVWHFFFRV